MQSLRGLTAMTHPCRGCNPGSIPGVGVFMFIKKDLNSALF